MIVVVRPAGPSLIAYLYSREFKDTHRESVAVAPIDSLESVAMAPLDSRLQTQTNRVQRPNHRWLKGTVVGYTRKRERALQASQTRLCSLLRERRASLLRCYARLGSVRFPLPNS